MQQGLDEKQRVLINQQQEIKEEKKRLRLWEEENLKKFSILEGDKR